MSKTSNAAHSAWSDALDRLRGADEIIDLLSDPTDGRLGLEACAHLMMCLGQGYTFNLAADPDFPHFQPNFHWPNPSLGNSPDFTYYHTPLRAQGTYRIWGRRNSIYMVDFQVGEAFWGTEEGGNNKAIASYDLDDFTIGADGSFAFILSAERPAGWKGDWRPLPPTAETLMTRQCAYDWFSEKQAELNIVRLDPPAATPRRKTADEYRKALRAAVTYAIRVPAQFTRYTRKLREDGFINGKVHATDFSDVGGFSDQMYYDGAYELAEDEALILETDVPQRCRFWNLQLIDELLAAGDYIFRHGSLNGRQARIDSDGRFRVVLSSRDPGVANWLDTGGLRTGLFMGRWKGADRHPIPTGKRVRLTEIDRHLPPDTVRVNPEERAATVMARRLAMLRRIGH